MSKLKEKDLLWDDNPVDITQEANFIWSIANKLRGSYMPDKYGDVIIPMTIIRRFECALSDTKDEVIKKYKENSKYPDKAMCRISGYDFFNTSEFSLEELCSDPDNIASNFKSYLDGFSSIVQDILKELEMEQHIKKMDKDGCLYNVVKAFSELDLSVKTYDPIKMGYIFENLIGRFFQNVEAGQYYTGRDIIKLLVSLLISEGSDDIFDEGKVITICDQACGTGGMLTTAYSYLKHYNPSADVRLFGQELMGQTYAVALAEMLIKGQSVENLVHVDTLKEDHFSNQKMRYVIENPPFGTSWKGENAKQGQEVSVLEEFNKGMDGRWGAGLPASGDSQLLFLQSAVDKLSDIGRAAIIENGSPLTNGGTASGESQIRRWLIESDLIEAIIQMPNDLFYNTGISTYIWILSKSKRAVRKGKIQLIDASKICHKLVTSLGNKKNEFSPNDRKTITELYSNFKENEFSKIYNNEEFLYREYAVKQPLQRSYTISELSIKTMIQSGSLNQLWNQKKVISLENKGTNIKTKEKKILENFYKNKNLYDEILHLLKLAISDKKWLSQDEFRPVLEKILSSVDLEKKILDRIIKGLSIMDKDAEIQVNKKGEVLYDSESKDSEIVKWEEDIESYMEREVLPHLPDAQWFWEEDLNKKTPVIRTGAEIPFTKYFYKYKMPTSSENLKDKLYEIDNSVNSKISKLFSK